jgi:predicted peptidase
VGFTGDKGKIVLIAPELPRAEELEAMASNVFCCVVDDARLVANLDAKRIYVFGNSMGGCLAYDAMTFDAEYFAAVGVHAMGITPGTTRSWITRDGRRRRRFISVTAILWFH